jgi:regulatory protein
MSPEQKITAIDAQERRGNRRSIFINGKFALGVDETVIADLGLHVGQEISEEELGRVVRAELLAKAKERALNLLEYRDRSRVEIARRLRQAGYAEDIIEEVLGRLSDIGFVDDARFSRSWVESRSVARGIGKARIKWELRQKGVEADLVEEATSEIDEETEYQSAARAARAKWGKDHNPDASAKRRRLASYLQRQGFGWDVIKRVVDELAGEDDD